MKFLPILLLSLISGLVFSGHSLGFNCQHKSFEYTRLGEKYFEMSARRSNVTALSQKLPNFYRDITGTWQGSLEVKECRGSNRRSRQTVHHADIEADIKRGRQELLKLYLKKSFITKREISQEKLELFSQVLMQRLSFEDHGIFSSELYRRRGYGGASVLIEVETQFQRRGRQLKIQQWIYTNGLAQEQRTLHLKKIR